LLGNKDKIDWKIDFGLADFFNKYFRIVGKNSCLLNDKSQN
jgi:hypothetical protein